MCEVCRQTPCHPRCPNAPDPPIVYYCVGCGEEIREGDYYYKIARDAWCCNCIEDCRKEAEIEEE